MINNSIRKMCLCLMISIASLSFSKVFSAEKVDVLSSEFIYDVAPFPQCHASTIIETEEGLLAAWFGGTHERNPDVCIYTSANKNGEWDIPVMVADGIINDTLRYPCWNPVLFQVPDGPVMLFYKIGPNAREWWGMLKTSVDHGKTWSDARRLPEGILGPIKNKPVLIEGNYLLCPSSTENSETDRWQVHFEITQDFGETWKIIELVDPEAKFNIIQPSILFHRDDRLQMLARSKENYIVSSWSADKGKTWSNPQPSSLPNPNSGTDAVTLQNGMHLLVYNHATITEGKWGGPRTPLNVAISEDGINWKTIYVLEDQVGEYSYPAVIQGKDGTIHITYTYNRKTIKYVCLKLT